MCSGGFECNGLPIVEECHVRVTTNFDWLSFQPLAEEFVSRLVTSDLLELQPEFVPASRRVQRPMRILHMPAQPQTIRFSSQKVYLDFIANGLPTNHGTPIAKPTANATTVQTSLMRGFIRLSKLLHYLRFSKRRLLPARSPEGHDQRTGIGSEPRFNTWWR
jgi:hypothetical protein